MHNILTRTQALRKLNLKNLKSYYQIKTARLHPAPIIILGSPKSGTTVIATLLAKSIGKNCIIDPFYQIPKNIEIREKLHTGERSFDSFFREYKFYFSTGVIKDPYLIFYYEAMLHFFRDAKFIFVSRDPRDNIRSILNRLKIPGNLEKLDPRYIESLPKRTAWSLLLEGKLPEVHGENYIENLSYRWRLASDIYNANSNRITLFRYEDFIDDKVNSIENLAKKLDQTPLHDISSQVDIQYQPIGNRKVSWVDFFGKSNLYSVESICHEQMISLGYNFPECS